MNPLQQLTGKTALVTGASSGIGRAVAQSLIEHECRVVGLARDLSKLDIKSDRFEAHSQDLVDLEATADLVNQLLKSKHFDYFIHCAGSGLFGSIEQFSVSQIERYMKSNLTSALVLSHYIVPTMRKRKSGCIIFIGSESALNAGKKGVLYSSAKFGLRGLALSLREDCSKDGVGVSLINPGMVRSPFFDQQNFRPGQDPANAIEVRDIADTVLHILRSNPNIVFDEINVSPRNKSIEFKKTNDV